MGKIALIDGDIVAYRCASSCEVAQYKVREALEAGLPIPEVESEGIAKSRANELLDRILNACETAEYRIFVSGTENFRKLLYPEYKANRDDVPRPRHLDAVRDLLVREWGAEVMAGCEADDGIGIAAREGAIIVSNDKDFQQIPGRHYNFVTGLHQEISPDEAALAFWSHMLIGDRTDNVRGVTGIGEVKARRHLSSLAPAEMEARVRELFGDDGRFVLTRKLLTILRSEEALLVALAEVGLLDEAPVCESERTALTAEGEG